MKPFAESCEENKTPILQVLMRLFADTRSVLEIGSGTGQHAVHIAAAMPHLIWQTSEVAALHAGIHAWLDEAALANLRYPLDLDVRFRCPESSGESAGPSQYCPKREFLELHGCPVYQGYLFSKPLDLLAFEKLLVRQRTMGHA